MMVVNMSPQQMILTNAVKKAINNGWQEQLREDPWHVHEGRMPGRFDLCLSWADQATYHIDMFGIIYDQAFARALWGDGKPSGETVLGGPEWEITLADGTHKYLTLRNWQYHLQQMVVAEDPIAYLGANI